MSERDFPTPTELKVMMILRDAPKGLYGLQIVEHGISRGSVYVLLSRLENKGFIEVDRSPPRAGYPGLPRPHYKLSAVGAKVMTMAKSLNMLPVGV
jgi:DNA-binding PadR family transcriptional regulator